MQDLDFAYKQSECCSQDLFNWFFTINGDLVNKYGYKVRHFLKDILLDRTYLGVFFPMTFHPQITNAMCITVAYNNYSTRQNLFLAGDNKNHLICILCER